MTHVKITKKSEIPLLGSVYFGIIDRGTNLLQVRPSCGCNLNCPFCSVDAGPESTTRTTSYDVEMEYLVEAVKEIAVFKGTGVECHIDSPGEPVMYPHLPDLIAALKKIDEVSIISLQTNGTLLNTAKIAALESAGLDRINLSLHALDPAIAKMLAGVEWFDIDTLITTAKAIAQSNIDLLIAPVYVPGINDEEIPKLIRFAKEIGAGKRFPPLGIQKFERYKYGRTPKGIKVQKLVAVFQQEHPAMGERVRNQAPAGFCPGLWDGKAPFYPSCHFQGGESHRRNTGTGLDNGRDAWRYPQPGSFRIQLREKVRAGPGEDCFQ